MYTFFDQWIDRKGHPELDIEISLEHNDNENNYRNKSAQLTVRIIQSQELDNINDTCTNIFEFP